MTVLVTIALLLLTMPAWAAPEARCTELGANCHCANSLDGTTLSTLPADSNYKTVNDGSTKSCGWDYAGYPIWTSANLTMTTDSTILNAMGTGRTVQRVVRGANQHEGGWWLGTTSWPSLSGVKRLAIRWYRYYSSDFGFTVEEGQTGCHNHKTAQLQVAGEGAPIGADEHPNISWGMWGTFASGLWAGTLNGVYNSSWSSDCCWWGPRNTYDGGTMPKTYMRGHWWREELVVRNPQGGASPNGFDFLYYRTAVNNPDVSGTQTVINFREGCPTCDPLNEGSQFRPGTDVVNPAFSNMAANLNRQRTTDTTLDCTGFNAVSHLLVAYWNTDAGQTIGAATEIEGGAAGSPPTGSLTLSIRSLIPVFWVIGVTLLAALCIIMAIRRRQYERAQIPLDGGADPVGKSVRTRPVVWPPTTPGHAIQPVVRDAPTDELVGVANEMEGTHATRERDPQEVVR